MQILGLFALGNATAKSTNRGLRGVNTDDSLVIIQDIDKKLEENTEQQNVLVTLMTKGYLDRVVYKKSSNNLLQEADRLQRQKESINHLLQNGNQHLSEVSALLRYATKATMLKRFDGDVFMNFVYRIIVYSRAEIGFELKCGITLSKALYEIMIVGFLVLST
jgi:site-specific DNA recombinase